MKDRIDHEPDPVPQIVTSEDTIAIPPPSQDEGSAAAGDQVKDSPNRREWLGPVKTMFNAVEGVSGMIPVIGTYVGAAAKVGSTVVEIIQVKQCGLRFAFLALSDATHLANGRQRRSR